SDYQAALDLLADRGPGAQETPHLAALRAECLWGLARESEARDALDAALAKHPSEPELLRLRARLHLAAQEPAKAAALLERVVAAQPHDHASRYQLVQAYETLGRRQDAEAQRALWQKTQEALQKLTKVVNEAADRPWDA